MEYLNTTPIGPRNVHPQRFRMYMCYRISMEVTITQFRKQLFALANQALEGTEVWVKHKGRRFKLTPEDKPKSKLDRLTPMSIWNDDVPDTLLYEEMSKAWEKDWEEQF